ncbi:MAG: helix-hairpin-helix domain-containing protein, partial [Bacillota bacterium]
GEVVLFLPKWVGGADKYINEECEPVTSKLTSPRAMAEQILIELFAGYSKTREHLIQGFLPLTLFHHQHPEANISKVINTLILADMLAIKQEEDKQGNQFTTLRPTKLGRLAVRLMFSPATVKLIKELYLQIKRPYFFDLLFMAALTEDCNPVLPANYEDLDALIDIVQPAPSKLLDMTLERIKKVGKECTSTLRILAAIKMATICYALVNNRVKEELARLFDIYEADIDILKDNMVRLLDGMAAIFNALDNADNEEDNYDETKDYNLPSRLCKRLSTMLYYEIDAQGVNLTYIPGVGGKIAKDLIGHGYQTVEEIAALKPRELTKIQGIGLKLAKKIVTGARAVLEHISDFTYQEESLHTVTKKNVIKTSICPYRLRRSLELRIRGHEGKFYYVTGGREDHLVTKNIDGFSCDCKDYEINQQDCKHILAVKRLLMDREVCSMMKKLKEDKNHSLRIALPSLWFSVSNTDLSTKGGRS